MQEVKTEIFDERAILVGVATQTVSEQKAKEYLDELAFLADTNNTNCVKRFVQRLDSPNTSTYVGEGKLQEINEYIQRFADTDDFIDMVIFVPAGILVLPRKKFLNVCAFIIACPSV